MPLSSSPSTTTTTSSSSGVVHTTLPLQASPPSNQQKQQQQQQTYAEVDVDVPSTTAHVARAHNATTHSTNGSDESYNDEDEYHQGNTSPGQQQSQRRAGTPTTARGHNADGSDEHREFASDGNVEAVVDEEEVEEEDDEEEIRDELDFYCQPSYLYPTLASSTPPEDQQRATGPAGRNASGLVPSSSQSSSTDRRGDNEETDEDAGAADRNSMDAPPPPPCRGTPSPHLHADTGAHRSEVVPAHAPSPTVKLPDAVGVGDRDAREERVYHQLYPTAPRDSSSSSRSTSRDEQQRSTHDGEACHDSYNEADGTDNVCVRKPSHRHHTPPAAPRAMSHSYHSIHNDSNRCNAEAAAESADGPYVPPLMAEYDGELLQIIRSYYVRKRAATAAAATTARTTVTSAEDASVVSSRELNGPSVVGSSVTQGGSARGSKGELLAHTSSNSGANKNDGSAAVTGGDDGSDAAHDPRHLLPPPRLSHTLAREEEACMLVQLPAAVASTQPCHSTNSNDLSCREQNTTAMNSRDVRGAAHINYGPSARSAVPSASFAPDYASSALDRMSGVRLHVSNHDNTHKNSSGGNGSPSSVQPRLSGDGRPLTGGTTNMNSSSSNGGAYALPPPLTDTQRQQQPLPPSQRADPRSFGPFSAALPPAYTTPPTRRSLSDNAAAVTNSSSSVFHRRFASSLQEGGDGGAYGVDAREFDAQSYASTQQPYRTASTSASMAFPFSGDGAAAATASAAAANNTNNNSGSSGVMTMDPASWSGSGFFRSPALAAAGWVGGAIAPRGGVSGQSGSGGALASGLSALSSLPSYSSTSFVRAYVSDISLSLEPAVLVSALTAALNIIVVAFLQHHVLDTRDHLGLFLIGSYMIFASYYMIYYFLERFSGSFRRIASQDKKFYIIGNLIKAGILVSITPFACVHLVKIIVFDAWESNILRNLGCIYAIPDFISMIIVRRMRWSTWIHHACVIVFNYFSIMNNYQHENVCRCVVVYAAFSSFAYCVNVLLASRFLGVSVNAARVLSFVALVVYALCCAVNWAWQVYYLRRLLTTGHEHWTVYAYMFLISLVMWDDIYLNRWLLHHARNNSYAASQHLQQHRMRQQQQSQQRQPSPQSSPLFAAQLRPGLLFRSQSEQQLPGPQIGVPPRAL
ncbi:hypothetical protein ABB37_09761 [Leptomonas pyrrhocoris]|uniref:Transmembrane protein n=1 Tax=Leptomonas pyrrhocoris TaxID=157538 RepID=A0A0M9FQ44_LEPPY|nr:hypothetical protein ABB37_09761 [Leptomonas pyrrhocoris]KPA73629.1 hypothetical protein ABB37_09761 [Leptomonas pyrrhocoris]|eukprot:XP_015652068.1 hypothetical protein ABB37_09761 [Leptomonas pyrrhocoris]